MQLSSNVFLVGGDDPFKFNANSYLIQGSQNFLIDCGSFEGLPALSYHLAEHKLSFRDIEMIIGTHCHRDQIQASAVLPTPVWLHHKGIQAAVEGDPILTESYLFHKQYKPLLTADLIDGYSGDTVIFDDGSLLDFVHTPGHSPDSCCFHYQPADGPNILFAGDTVWGGFNEKIGSDLTKWKKSLEKILELDFDLLLTAHSGNRKFPASKPDLKKAFATFANELVPDFGDLLSPWSE